MDMQNLIINIGNTVASNQKSKYFYFHSQTEDSTLSDKWSYQTVIKRDIENDQGNFNHDSSYHIIAAINYKDEDFRQISGGMMRTYSIKVKDDETTGDEGAAGISTNPQNPLANGIAVFRREIWYNPDLLEEHQDTEGKTFYTPTLCGDKQYKTVTPYYLGLNMYDFNIARNHYYEYICTFQMRYQSEVFDSQYLSRFIIHPTWQNYSLTELTEAYNDEGEKYYIADDNNIWKFRCNLSPGAQNQNITKTQQDTLAQFPRFSHGLKNHLSGSLTCLLGDVSIADYTTTKYEYKEVKLSSGTTQWLWQPTETNSYYNLGGYQEKIGTALTQKQSNRAIDMLDKWRKICYSGNPKLFKDDKGQIFIVQITENNNTTHNTWDRQPEEISFSWVQIDNAEDYRIIKGD